MNFYTYIAECSDDTYYTGYCKDIQSREDMHNSGKGAKYTRGRTPIKIVYHEVFETVSEALKRELQIKKLTRNKKVELIISSSN
jgi:putative endonuclease